MDRNKRYPGINPTKRKFEVLEIMPGIYEIYFPRKAGAKPSYYATIRLVQSNKYSAYIEQRTKPPKKPWRIGFCFGELEQAVEEALNLAVITHQHLYKRKQPNVHGRGNSFSRSY